MVRHLARHDIEVSWLHPSARRWAIRVPDRLRRIAGRDWTRFSLADVPSVRYCPSAVSVSLDSWMSGSLSDAQFRALQRTTRHNNSPCSNRVDHFRRSCDLVVEEQMNAKCLAPAFLLSYQLASQAQQGLLLLPLALRNKC